MSNYYQTSIKFILLFKCIQIVLSKIFKFYRTSLFSTNNYYGFQNKFSKMIKKEDKLFIIIFLLSNLIKL